jgi:hypothetical protein
MAALIGINLKKDASGTGGYVCKVPLDLLAADGVPPSEGDSVDYSVSGTVQSVDAEDATVKIEAVNGQPVDESAATEASEDAGSAAPSAAPPGSSASMRPGLAAKAKKGGLGMF